MKGILAECSVYALSAAAAADHFFGCRVPCAAPGAEKEEKEGVLPLLLH